MKYDPVSLFEITIIQTKNDHDYALDIAPSRELLKHCTNALTESKNKDADLLSADDAYKLLAAAIIDYAYRPERKN